MVATINTVAFEGVRTFDIEVQVQIAPGLPAFTVVGLPDKAVTESRERVRSAIHALGLSIPAKKIIINLSPADIVKEGAHFDVPIALALLVALGAVAQDALQGFYAMGELALDGRILPVAGVLPAALHANTQNSGIICPAANGREAAWTGVEPILAADSLLALINHFKGVQVLSSPSVDETLSTNHNVPDLAEVKGQFAARRALEIAAAGAHNLLMCGPPGAGKSLLAACLPGILPQLDSEEILESSMIASIAGKLEGGRLSNVRPFRSPHHSSSMAAMVGGGKRALPGEISLAHHGILFLDELPEFPRGVLESLRQPLETGNITVARAEAHVTYPARFQLIAAMNPCRCGFLTDPARACSKAPRCGTDYQSKLSGPLLDRIDLTIDVPEVLPKDVLNAPAGEPSSEVRKRVVAARSLQKQRYASLDIRTNAELNGDMLKKLTELDTKGNALIEQAFDRFRLSMRGYTRVLRVARTIADLEGAETIASNHLAEALSYRQIEPQLMAA